MSGAVARAHCHPAGGAALGGTLGAAASGETVLVTRVETCGSTFGVFRPEQISNLGLDFLP